ncbi:MAG: hypothetical protein U0Q18_00225 [Bryobacteraceae bacterium]
MSRTIMLVLTLLSVGRAMTLFFLSGVGSGLPGDPPTGWLMPLVGDAVIGVTALGIAYLIATKSGLGVWSTILVWNAIAIWDALSAFLIHRTIPWPEFFMVRMLGSSMFFAASAMHLAIIALACRPDVRAHFLGRGVVKSPTAHA